jgi:hypothetical protein
MKVTVNGTGHQVSVTARDGAKAAQVGVAHPGARAVATAGAAEGADFGQGRRVTAFAANRLKHARGLEPLVGPNIRLGDGAGLGTAIAPARIRKT